MKQKKRKHLELTKDQLGKALTKTCNHAFCGFRVAHGTAHFSASAHELLSVLVTSGNEDSHAGEGLLIDDPDVTHLFF